MNIEEIGRQNASSNAPFITGKKNMDDCKLMILKY